MNKIRLSFIAGLAALFTAACSDNIVEAGDSAIETQATLKVQVLDAITFQPIEGAEVKNAGGSSKKTDANGTASLGKASVGVHRLTVVPPAGYASGVYDANIQVVNQGDNASTNEGIFIASENVTQILLYPLNASLEGHVFYNDKDGQRKPAKDVDVSITFRCDDVTISTEQVAPVKAGADGKFAFEKLPASCNINLKFSSFTADGISYAGMESDNNSLGTNAKAVLDAIEYTDKVLPAFVITSFTQKVSLTENIKIEFSDAVDVSKFRLPNFSYYQGNSAIYDEIWSNGNKTLTLTLFGGSEWDQSNESIFIEATSTSGAHIQEDIIIDTRLDLRGKKVEKLTATVVALDDNVTFGTLGTITLTFDEVKGARYKAYFTADKGTNKAISRDCSPLISKGKVTCTFNNLGNYSLSYDAEAKPFAGGGKITVNAIATAEGGNMLLEGSASTTVTKAAAL